MKSKFLTIKICVFSFVDTPENSEESTLKLRFISVKNLNSSLGRYVYFPS